MLRSQKE
jgi:hypothetical protein